MTAYALRTRRMILKDMGKAGLAIMVMGTAACASDESDPTTTPADPDPTTSGATESTAAPDTTEPPAPSSTAGSQAVDGWHRASIDFVSAYILVRAGEAALVDTGVPGSEATIEAALTQAGVGWDAVGHVIVTHQHNDHQGSIGAVLAATNGANWYAGAADLGAIRATGGTAVGDGDSVFDLEIIDTPGHTLGHICVLDNEASTLVAGDALFGTESGGVTGSLPQFTTDMEMANASVKKLATFDYEVLLFGHGEPIPAAASTAVTALADAL